MPTPPPAVHLRRRRQPAHTGPQRSQRGLQRGPPGLSERHPLPLRPRRAWLKIRRFPRYGVPGRPRIKSGAAYRADPTGALVVYLTPDVKRIAGALHYLHRDGQNSVRAITDAAGTLTRASAYEPYGVQLETAINPLTPVESKGYIGERTDPETGLTYLHARYLYALGDPINRSDPNGHIVSDVALQAYGMTEQLEFRARPRAAARYKAYAPRGSAHLCECVLCHRRMGRPRLSLAHTKPHA